MLYEVWLNSLCYFEWIASYESEVVKNLKCILMRPRFCVFPMLQYQYIWMTLLYQRLWNRFFTTPLFSKYCWKWSGFFLGRQPSFLSVVCFSDQSGILHNSSPWEELINTKCQSCLKIFCRCSRKYQGHDRAKHFLWVKGLYINTSWKTAPSDLCCVTGGNVSDVIF